MIGDTLLFATKALIAISPPTPHWLVLNTLPLGPLLDREQTAQSFLVDAPRSPMAQVAIIVPVELPLTLLLGTRTLNRTFALLMEKAQSVLRALFPSLARAVAILQSRKVGCTLEALGCLGTKETAKPFPPLTPAALPVIRPHAKLNGLGTQKCV